MSIPKNYDAHLFEDDIYKKWEQSGAFKPSDAKETFSIVMPPPNATGHLHLGHATMLAIEDIMVRYKRMQGFATLWVPGTDHASIATQSKVEKLLHDREGKTRHDYGREAFLKHVEEYVEGSQGVIRNQVRKMGSSCDWSREAYTMDPEISKAVQKVFINMFNDGLIYRGDRIVNWDPKMQTTVADDEIEYVEHKAKFYYFQYGPFVIGTARPETKFADKIVVVNPDDDRYKEYVGQEIEVEWINGPIKARVIADEAVEKDFGTGAMTITPAHSVIDFELAEKYDFKRPQIIDFDGKLLPIAGEFAGMHISEARDKIVEKLDEKGLLVKVDEDYVHNLATNYRGGGTIEPQIKRQWFIDVNKAVIDWNGDKKSLKDISLEVVKNGDIEIIPERFNKTYFHWMENLRDWCISRQIWFGHRIPVWYKDEEVQASIESPGEGWTQDPDTLDTWFSSGLWTFTTLGWPENTEDLERFHPTNILETGYDIIFFWVARMILMTTYNTGQVPFKQVYLHGLVRDKQGRKMSKSLGNGIDPLDMISKYGTDAVRLSLVIGTSPGNDLKLYEEKIANYRNFVTKLWNSARFALMNIESSHLPLDELQTDDVKTPYDKWILSRTQEIITSVSNSLDQHRFSEAGTELYNFLWSEFANWYLEFSKQEKNEKVLHHVLKQILIMLHPFMPFVTEVIWAELKEPELLINMQWPEVNDNFKFDEEKEHVNDIIEIVQTIRALKTSFNLHHTKDMQVTLEDNLNRDHIKDAKEQIIKHAKIGQLNIQSENTQHDNCAATVINPSTKVYLHLDGKIDIEAEKKKIESEIKKLEGFLTGLEKQMSNKSFVDNAPKEVIEKKRAQQEETQEKINQLKTRLDNLS